MRPDVSAIAAAGARENFAEDISEVEQKRHFAIRKPPFYPLNYGNNDLERINGLNGDGQDTVAVRGQS